MLGKQKHKVHFQEATNWTVGIVGLLCAMSLYHLVPGTVDQKTALEKCRKTPAGFQRDVWGLLVKKIHVWEALICGKQAQLKVSVKANTTQNMRLLKPHYLHHRRNIFKLFFLRNTFLKFLISCVEMCVKPQRLCPDFSTVIVNN